MCYNNSKYRKWLSEQEKDFIKEVCLSNPIPDKFLDFNYKAITLDELKELDNKFINNSPAGGENNE